MAGSIGNGGVFWNVGDTTGRDDSGQVADLPVAVTAISSGSPTPTTAPGGAPLYIDTDTDELYVWAGTDWKGPYGLSSSFALTSHTHT